MGTALYIGIVIIIEMLHFAVSLYFGKCSKFLMYSIEQCDHAGDPIPQATFRPRTNYAFRSDRRNNLYPIQLKLRPHS